jgi:hypothetical protein
VEQLIYYRSLSRGSAIWREGKEVKNFPSLDKKENYLTHMKAGKGFPSIWLPSNNGDLEKIALGIMLSRGHFDQIELIGFHESCFEKTNIPLKQVTDSKFPLPSVGNLHYELCTNSDNDLVGSIGLFLNCNGHIKTFKKKSTDKNEVSMLNIVKTYAEEISGDRHIEKANGWIEKYDVM